MNEENRFYNGNRFLPKADIEREYTSEQISEIKKCTEDCLYFARKYVKIVHVDKGLIDLELYDFQEEFIQKCFKYRNIVSVQARQSGKTTTAAIVLLHTLIFNKEKTVAILANKAATAREILRRIKNSFENLPDFLKPGVVEWNKGSIALDNGCIAIAESSSSDNIRSKSISVLFLDELAFIPNWDEFSASVLPTLSSGDTTKLIIASTPHGLNHFYQIVEGARKGVNGYGLIEVPWWKVPGRDENWKQNTLEQLNFDYQKFAQEYEIEFQGSSGTLISGSKLKQLEYKNPINDDIHLKIYENEKTNHIYVIVVDTSEGKLQDYSALSVFDVTEDKYVQVCTYRSNEVNAYDYAVIVDFLSKKYNDAHILVELNNPSGTIVSEQLFFELENENLIYTQTSKNRKGKQVSTGFGGARKEKGIITNKTVKASGCSFLKLLIEQDKLIINDKNTISELMTFIKIKQSYQAESGKHDDLVIGLVLFAWLINQKLFQQMIEKDNFSEGMREREIEELINGLGIMVVNDGIEYHDDAI